MKFHNHNPINETNSGKYSEKSVSILTHHREVEAEGEGEVAAMERAEEIRRSNGGGEIRKEKQESG